MDFFVLHLEDEGYRVEVFDEIYFAYGEDDLMMFSWDGVFIAELKEFNKWGDSKLNSKPLPIPYTDEQLDEFWAAVKVLRAKS